MNEVNCIRTDSSNSDFRKLVEELDTDLAIRDGDEHPFYAQFNKLDSIKHVIVVYLNGMPVGCGAFKPFDAYSVEIKRMYVPPTFRNQGIASLLLQQLESWASETGYTRAVLETGKRQVEAIALYNRNGYERMENFGQYAGKENSVCFQKKLVVTNTSDKPISH
jgi:GNAT superfamily N-acetyltransferase